MPTDSRLEKVAAPLEHKLRPAFRDVTFVYGTMGKGSSVVRAAKVWRKCANEKSNRIQRELNLFDPGERAGAFLKGDGNAPYQMMDMYYGQAGNNLHLQRNRIIAEFVHFAMGFKGPFKMEESGREAFQKSYGTNLEGWDTNAPKINGSTATVEISRIIRWGIERYGGKLIFEGKEVYYSQVFNCDGYKGDTDREAISLFQYFKPGQSKVPFGAGAVTFQWGGKEIIPTHCHFLSNWSFPSSEEQVKFFKDRGNEHSDKFDAAAAKKPEAIGALQHSALNRGNLTTWLSGRGVRLNTDLWQNFRDKPAGLEDIPINDIVEHCATGLRRGTI